MQQQDNILLDETNYKVLGLKRVIFSQAILSFGDNFILMTLFAIMKADVKDQWLMSLLPIPFFAAYLVISPIIGQITDNSIKRNILLIGAVIKLFGGILFFNNVNIFIAYAVLGISGAINYPCRYSILTDLTTGKKLLKANSYFEAFNFICILVGILGGGIIADYFPANTSFTIVLITYFISATVVFFIPKIKPERKNLTTYNLNKIITNFIQQTKFLLTSKRSRFCIIIVATFWGIAIILRNLLFDWMSINLGYTNNTTPAVLYLIIIIGISIGTNFAYKYMSIYKLNRIILAGCTASISLILLFLQTNIICISVLLATIGVSGGLVLIPLNAFIQKFGRKSIGSSSAVAVQNFVINIVSIIWLSLYTFSSYIYIPINLFGCIAGVLFTGIILYLWYMLKK